MKFSHDNILSHSQWLHLSRVQAHNVHSDIISPKKCHSKPFELDMYMSDLGL